MVKFLEDGAGSAGKSEDAKADKTRAEPIDHQRREWTGTNGKRFKAKFIEDSRGQVALELENGRKRVFSEEDIVYIKKYAK